MDSKSISMKMKFFALLATVLATEVKLLLPEDPNFPDKRQILTVGGKNVGAPQAVVHDEEAVNFCGNPNEGHIPGPGLNFSTKFIPDAV